MYHRVLPEKKTDGIQAGMYVKSKIFEAHLTFLKKHFKIISLSELFTYPPPPPLKKEEKKQKPWCILTFDDGWYDFYEYAFPLLKEFQAPATVFLPTDFIGTNKWFWTDRLAEIFLQKHKITPPIPPLVKGGLREVIEKLENLKGSLESRLERAIEILKAYREEEIEEILSALSVRRNIDQALPNRAFLSWEELREMAQSGLISFGSHTATHRILTTLKDEEIWDELTRSKKKLIAEKVVDSSFIPFSYPNGNYNEKIAKMVKEAGYSLAVTTENGWNHFGSDPFTLKRIGIHQDISYTEAMFGCRIINLF